MNNELLIEDISMSKILSTPDEVKEKCDKKMLEKNEALEKQNKEMLKLHQEYFVENEKLKQELKDCIMSNELLDKENDRLRQEYKVINSFNQYIDSVYADKQIKELKQENEKLREELQDYKNCNEILENELERYKLSDREAYKYVSELIKKLAEYEKFGLDKELEKLKQTEGFGNIWIPMGTMEKSE